METERKTPIIRMIRPHRGILLPPMNHLPRVNPNGQESRRLRDEGDEVVDIVVKKGNMQWTQFFN